MLHVIHQSLLSSITTQYHVAAEQQDIGNGDDECDRISLNCEDGSLSSHSTGEHYAMDDILNRSENGNEEQNEKTNTGALDFSFKMDGTNEHLLNSTNRSRS